MSLYPLPLTPPSLDDSRRRRAPSCLVLGAAYQKRVERTHEKFVVPDKPQRSRELAPEKIAPATFRFRGLHFEEVEHYDQSATVVIEGLGKISPGNNPWYAQGATTTASPSLASSASTLVNAEECDHDHEKLPRHAKGFYSPTPSASGTAAIASNKNREECVTPHRHARSASMPILPARAEGNDDEDDDDTPLAVILKRNRSCETLMFPSIQRPPKCVSGVKSDLVGRLGRRQSG
ncbi:hypothetical protein FA10DRAFT_263638 [Acaromyces ingoldii]|uniref:Uncharacterized protein n=1 Tax=Acaromyces ingoldii TaxID=215250 RepID=A0A316YUI9_9BASI|nr:hypothetical protein FA10DRAFT_263638 [Acaromyces ingoldii]PWN92901.1 hypothetical protein FA10DRAFT_263638 [Acaromyces ingoldii]